MHRGKLFSERLPEVVHRRDTGVVGGGDPPYVDILAGQRIAWPTLGD